MAGKGGSRWGSLLSGAVAGLESRLDTILADDDQASAKLRVAEEKAKQEAAVKAAADKGRLQAEPGLSRNPSRSRPNSRLQDRLAKAVNKGAERASSSTRGSLDIPSRSESPVLKNVTSADTNRPSMESRGSETAVESSRSSKETPVEADATKSENPPKISSESMPSDTTARSTVSEQPPSIPIPEIMTPHSSPQSFQSPTSRPSLDVPASVPVLDISAPRDSATVEAELSSLRETHEKMLAEHREEMNSHLERIDALQSKLTYLTHQLASQAKAAASSSDTKDPLEKKLADKDAQIAALMEEGQKLSKMELKHMTTIKKMRTKASELDKEVTNFKQRHAKAESTIQETTARARRAEAAEKAAQDKLKIVGKIEKDLNIIKAEREEAGLTIAELRRQLSDALSRAEDAEKRAQTGALEAEKRATASLREDIENLRIEKKLAEDRAKRELQEAKEQGARSEEKVKVTELELKTEIANLETKLELLRSRSEEASSSATGDAQAKLLRQIETLQTQYTHASQNWQALESTLTSRVNALEKERDEAAKREADVRRKAREVNLKSRRLEDELEASNERASILEQDLSEQRALTQKLEKKLAQAESAADDARADFEREKRVWEAELQQRLDEEKMKWRLEAQANSSSPPDPNYLHTDSTSFSNRRNSPGPLGYHGRKPISRVVSTSELPLSPMDRMLFEDSRRPSSSRKSTAYTQPLRTPEIGTPARQDSFPNSLSNVNGAGGGATISQTPSMYDEQFENSSQLRSPINEMLSISTVAAGPSVQLVERMSAAVRRLESEKAGAKEEMARLVAQRDEARDEVVALMREVEEKRGLGEKVGRLEGELREMERRYETTLELLGEKSERVEELVNDVKDLKDMYRELLLEKTKG
ncbi:M protein repeat protein-like protein [Delitschia confertaspora ATCC 74209]|uniref:M protein repeat protein-like protein n=1 Tax=Delitschia confertaspora ATCC 74209 TaxID=1513339 RepID=A0A9P4JMI6_9PLEO|nr:M protein repeat protein-like protein [Delitschia confertaspora ATCC 74209]